ncbi:MAG: hypothetical protein A2284_04905 [Deltaproteobacteria bacterium RIFOXYA12_FULL_61_11]|nr:MAG: hypothetical protein A2284_04905 [Deltaproteobacteria bacterium RIFOXYA12_FULL_61_11]
MSQVIPLLAPDPELHRRVRHYRGYAVPDFEQTVALLAASEPTATTYRLLVSYDTFHRLGELAGMVARSLGLEPPDGGRNPEVFPLAGLAKRYRRVREQTLGWAAEHCLELEVEEQTGLLDLLDRIAALAGHEDEEQLARYLGVLCHHVFIGPEIVHLDLSNTCNSNCQFCGYHSDLIGDWDWKTPGWDREQLPIIKAREVIGDLRDLRCNRHVAVCGEGDPATHPQVMEILSLLKQAGLGTALYTNGIGFRAADFRRMVDLGVDLLYVNLSAGTPVGYTSLQPRQTAEVFHRLVADLKAMVEYQRACGKRTPELTLKHVLTSLNYRELPDMVALSRHVGAGSLYPELMHFSGANTRHLYLEPAKIDELRGLWEQAKRDCAAHGIPLMDQLDLQLAGFSTRQAEEQHLWTYDLYRRRGCYAGWFFTRVYTDQSLGFCCRHRKLDSLQHQSLREALFSDTYQTMRIQAKRFAVEDNHRCSNGTLLLSPDCNQCGNFYTNETYYRELVRLGLSEYLDRPAGEGA